MKAACKPVAENQATRSGMVLQRKCACGAHRPGGGACPECAKKRQLAQRKTAHQDGGGDAPASVHDVIGSPGQPLGASARAFMEPRFGQDLSQVRVNPAAPAAATALTVGAAHDPLEREADAIADRVVGMASPDRATRFDLSGVRIHTDAAAAASARELHARAYTVGNHIAFDSQAYSPDTRDGRLLLAHELAHTVQQAQTGVALQRFVPCTRARLSTEDCPKRDADEDRTTRAQPMILEYVTAPEAGFLVANFDIARSTIKSDLKRHPLWPTLVKAVSEPKSQWEIIGLSDCHGDEPLNTGLRKQRADAVRAFLPPSLAPSISATSGAALNDCMTDNGNAVARQWNRAALITPISREVQFDADEIQGKRPVPKPIDPDVVDCTAAQKKAIAQAQPIAKDMLQVALLRIRDQTDPEIKSLLRAYFGDDSKTTFEHVHDGLLTTLSGLSDLTVECESKGSWFYDHFCKEGNVVTQGYTRNRVAALHIHLCEAVFTHPDIDIAETIIHESSHLYDGTDDKGYCWENGGGACATMGPANAYNNADSYSNFAKQAWLHNK
jgi:hypothetical protein